MGEPLVFPNMNAGSGVQTVMGARGPAELGLTKRELFALVAMYALITEGKMLNGSIPGEAANFADGLVKALRVNGEGVRNE